MDLVPNHTSDRHPWFQAARRSRDDPKRDWYVWRDGGAERGPAEQLAGRLHRGTGVDLGRGHRSSGTSTSSCPQQPDLNWDEPAVVEAMHDVMRFWLDRGVDGFRIDVVHCIGRDPALPDDEPPWDTIPHCASNEHP